MPGAPEPGSPRIGGHPLGGPGGGVPGSPRMGRYPLGGPWGGEPALSLSKGRSHLGTWEATKLDQSTLNPPTKAGASSLRRVPHPCAFLRAQGWDRTKPNFGDCIFDAQDGATDNGVWLKIGIRQSRIRQWKSFRSPIRWQISPKRLISLMAGLSIPFDLGLRRPTTQFSPLRGLFFLESEPL